MSGSDFEILPPRENGSPAEALQIKDSEGRIYTAYINPHPAVTATVVLYDRCRDAYLLTRRSCDPYNGMFVFPGGFVDAGRESAQDAAARELFEETFIQVSADEMELVDERSAPERDPRDHVVDLGFFVEVSMAEACTGDGVSEVHWAKADELDAASLGFDHSRLWHHVRAFLRKRNCT